MTYVLNSLHLYPFAKQNVIYSDSDMFTSCITLARLDISKFIPLDQNLKKVNVFFNNDNKS